MAKLGHIRLHNLHEDLQTMIMSSVPADGSSGKLKLEVIPITVTEDNQKVIKLSQKFDLTREIFLLMFNTTIITTYTLTDYVPVEGDTDNVTKTVLTLTTDDGFLLGDTVNLIRISLDGVFVQSSKLKELEDRLSELEKKVQP